MNGFARSQESVREKRTRRRKTRQTAQRRLLFEPLEIRWLLTGVDPTVDELAQAWKGAAAVQAGTASADSAVTSYEYMVPTSYA